MTNNQDSPKPLVEVWRIYTFIIALSAVFFVFAVQLFSFQFVQAERWLAEAEENRVETISLQTRRGVIFDRNGILLAQNIASYNIAITPALLPDDDGEIQEIIRELSEFISLPIHRGDPQSELLINCGDNLGIAEMVELGNSFAPFIPVLVECNIDFELALAIQEKAVNWPGVSIQIEPIRDYPTGELTSTFIGYLGPIPEFQAEFLQEQGFLLNRDKVGYAGLELYFDPLLRGQNGQRVVEVDVAGEIIRDLESVSEPEKGYNLVLTIDMRLQGAMDAILKDEIDAWNRYFYGNTGEIRISSGVVAAINPQTGEVLGLVSWPTYENNRMARFIPAYYLEQLLSDSTQPLLNNVVMAEFPTGSVFKLVTAVGALNEGVVTPEQYIKTPGKIVIENIFTPNDPGTTKEFVDWYEPGFGQLNFIGGLSNSSNVYFYKLGGGYKDEIPDGGLGICRLGTYAEALGYNNELGIELPFEADGSIPNPTWKRITQGENWSTGDTYLSSVGQGFVVSSPMQVLASASIIANDGALMRPTLVREIVDNEGNVIPVVLDQFGNDLEVVTDPFGNLIINVFDGNGQPIEFTVLDFEGNPYDFIVNSRGVTENQIYDEEGDPIIPSIISPFVPQAKWDITQDHMITEYENPAGIGSCKPTGNYKLVEPWVLQTIQEAMRQTVVGGTLDDIFIGVSVPVAGKTGTAEYCDITALLNNRCEFGNWPTHAWTVVYAPYENPEIAVVAFMYNGGEGASVAGPVVRRVIEAYFELKAIDSDLGSP